MKMYRFKTNVKCSGCVAKIDHALERNPKSGTWKFDMDSHDKILEIRTELPPDEIAHMVNSAGYDAELLK